LKIKKDALGTQSREVQHIDIAIRYLKYKDLIKKKLKSTQRQTILTCMELRREQQYVLHQVQHYQNLLLKLQKEEKGQYK
jgi:hypothetical protein